MKIGFNKKTFLLVWDLSLLYVLIRGFMMSLGLWLPTKPLEPYEIQGFLIVLLAATGFQLFHRLFDEEEPITT